MKTKYIHILIALFFIAVIFSPRFCHASKIAVLTRGDIIPYYNFLRGFMKGCGQTEDRGVKVNTYYLSADFKKESKERAIKEKIKIFSPDLIVAIGSGALRFSIAHFQHIPIIYSLVLNPQVILNDNKNAAMGISMEVDIASKFNIMKQIKGDIKQIGTVYNPSVSGWQIREAESAARNLGIDFEAVSIADAKMAPEAIAGLMDRIDAYLIIFDNTVLAPTTIKFLLKSSFRKKVPLIGLSEKYVKLGALFALNYETVELGRETWKYAEHFLKGDEIHYGLIRVCSPVRLVINKRIALKMGLDIPQDLIAMAMRVYE